MQKDNFSPIILFVYNRLQHTRLTVEALLKNHLAKDSDIYIFADGAKEGDSEEKKHKVEEVREYIHTISGFKTITIEEAPKNKGLANSVIYGVTKVMEKHGKAIIVEDDIITNPFFLTFMNDCLNKYEDDKRLYSIGAYAYDIRFPHWHKENVYVVPRVESWGWATWKDRWDTADWQVTDYEKMLATPSMVKEFRRGGRDLWHMLKNQMEGKIDSWAVRWHYSMYKQNAYCLYPKKGYASNIGFDGSGVHCDSTSTGSSAAMQASEQSYDIVLPDTLNEDKYIERSFYVYWRNKTISPLHRLYYSILHYLHI